MHSLQHTFSSIDILSTYKFLCMSFCLFGFYLLKLSSLFFVFLVVCCSFLLIFFCASLLQCYRHFVDFFSSLMPNYFIANTTFFSFFICVALHILFKLFSMFFHLLYYGFFNTTSKDVFLHWIFLYILVSFHSLCYFFIFYFSLSFVNRLQKKFVMTLSHTKLFF